MSTPLLEAQSLVLASPGGKVLASGLNFSLAPGELLLVTGPNGSGKSTLLSLLLGEWKAAGGSLRTHVPRSATAVIPQLQNIDFHLPVTLRDVLEVAGVGPLSEERALGFGLLTSPQLDLVWNTASGGERQRALVTRALLRDPKLLVLDEPFNHLDDSSQGKILETLARFLKEGARERGAVLVSHLALAELNALGVPVRQVVLKGAP